MKANEFLLPLAKTAGVKAEEFYELLKEENRKGTYSIVPFKIDFEGKKIVHNAEQVLELANMAKIWASEVVGSSKIDKVEGGLELMTNLEKWFKSTRQSVTSSLDSVKKELMKPEKVLGEAKKEIKQGLDLLNEVEYQKTEEVLKDYLTEVQEDLKADEDIELDLLSMFDDFIARKRSTKALTEKGAVKKSVKDEVASRLNEVVSKIKEERAIKAEQDRQMQSFTVDLGKIDCQDAPNEALEQLKTLESELDIKYPAIKEMAVMQINANKQIALNVISQNEREAREKELADIEAKAVADVVKLKAEADKTDNIEELEAILNNIRDIRNTVKLAKTKDEINDIGIELKNKVATLKSKLVQKQTKKEEPQEADIEEINKANKWKIDRESAEALLATVVEADTEEEAQKLWLEEIIGQAKFMFDCGMLKINKEEG